MNAWVPLGTHKRSLDFPFIFGDGKINKKHKGRVISEKGCRATYSAITKTKTGKEIEACVYRKAYSGRIAAYYHSMVGFSLRRSSRSFHENGSEEAWICLNLTSCRQYETSTVT